MTTAEAFSDRRPLLFAIAYRMLATDGRKAGPESDAFHQMLCDQEVGSADHVGSTQPTARSRAGRPPAATTAEWREAVDRTLSWRASPISTPPWPSTAGRCACATC